MGRSSRCQDAHPPVLFRPGAEHLLQVHPLPRTLTALFGGGVASLLLATLGVAPALAAAPSVECGQLSAYTAPDPVAPADGSLQLGLTPAWDILATATIPPAVSSALSGAAGSGPTCLALTFDGSGKITSIDFAAHGTIEGPVTFDAGSSIYLFADRLLLPSSIADAYPALSALFKSSSQAGTPLEITFTVDVTTGAFVAFDGHASFCGKASLDSGGLGHVGKATLPAAVLGSTAHKNLVKYTGQRVCASVHSTGTIDPRTGDLATTSAVLVALADPGAAATPPATSTGDAHSPAPAPDSSQVVWWLGLASVISLAWIRFRLGRTIGS